MGHHLTTLIGARDVLVAVPLPGLRLLALAQGIHLAPMPEEILRPYREPRDLTDHEALDELARAASHAGPVGWLDSDWFGGVGDTQVALFRDGARVPATQNEMFAALGVVRTRPTDDRGWLARTLGEPPPFLDEWDSLGLGDWRSTRRAWEAATPIAEA